MLKRKKHFPKFFSDFLFFPSLSNFFSASPFLPLKSESLHCGLIVVHRPRHRTSRHHRQASRHHRPARRLTVEHHA
ncbi:hypothetical protein RJT34_16286 [Clitoria ternatea]|uniref:Uncharacterized protein n=1 Tax=Clitoria ternatea TaxID=43366 RepID=A0AAN9PCR4_CLITE